MTTISSSPHRRIAAIINSGAGSVIAAGLEADGLRRLFAEAGVEADVHFVPGDRIVTTARAALAAGAEALVAGGGDGTIRSVAGILVGGDVPLGVLPVGTLNHFARDLGIPVELPAAVRVIADGVPRALDVGEVNGEIFVNNSVLGLYPPVVQVRDQERREKNRNKWLATVSALWKVLPGHPLLHIRVKADGLAVDHQSRFVFVGNNEYEMSAFTYGARSRFDSGDLFLYIAKSRTRLGLVGLGLLSLFRDLKWTDRFDRFCLPELTIETRKKALPVYLDGEVVILNPPLRYRNQPHALRVILPE
ncbi:MAG TPA: diacylglycerol kinase family protein [Thermoanaerobaculia bacterium]|nr:diacylglycerol kinase family protein [Thermoanaerobaculia bacterium]